MFRKLYKGLILENELIPIFAFLKFVIIGYLYWTECSKNEYIEHINNKLTNKLNASISIGHALIMPQCRYVDVMQGKTVDLNIRCILVYAVNKVV